MIKKLAGLLLVSAFFLFVSPDGLCMAQETGTDITAEVIGYRVVAEGYGESDYGAELRAFNWTAGTSVTLIFKRESGGLVQLGEESTITSFVDNNGNDLLDKKMEYSNGNYTWSGDAVSEDSKAAMVEVAVSSLPVKGATSLEMAGEMLIHSATSSSEVKSDAVKLEKGTAASISDLDFSIEATGKPEWGDAPFAATIKWKGDIREVRNVKFYAADGSELEYENMGRMTAYSGNMSEVEQEIGLQEPVEAIVIGVDRWTDLEISKVPFSVTVSLGL